jgi:hypothetical protein
MTQAAGPNLTSLITTAPRPPSPRQPSQPGEPAAAVHTSPGMAERRGALAYLTRGGVGIDFGPGSEFITDAQAQAVHTRYPRLRMVTSLIDRSSAMPGAAPGTHPATPSPASWRESVARKGTRRRWNGRR